MRIRKYLFADKAACRDICLRCARGLKDGDGYREANYALYCDSFLDNGAEGLFVAVNDYDEPVGYVFSANVAEYVENFRNRYRKKLLFTAPDVLLAETVTERQLMKLKDEFPVLTVVNVRPEGQRIGIGGDLLKTLKDHLVAASVRGVVAVCPSKNTQACGFFVKNGFAERKKVFGYTFFTSEA